MSIFPENNQRRQREREMMDWPEFVKKSCSSRKLNFDGPIGGGQVVSMLAFLLMFRVRMPLKPIVFYVKFVFEKKRAQ